MSLGEPCLASPCVYLKLPGLAPHRLALLGLNLSGPTYTYKSINRLSRLT